MASFIQAIVKFGPKIRYGEKVGLDELVERLADTTGQRRGEVMRVLFELEATLLFYNRRGRAVDIPGIGGFRPIIRGDGSMRMRYRPEHRLITQLRIRELFAGQIDNEQNIGLTPEQYKELWDAEFPEDPLEPPRVQAA